MHIPDGYLGPSTFGALWAAMCGIWSYGAGKLKKELSISQVPYLAMASAFSFVAMIIAVPLPGGTTGHITGAALIAVLIGPWASVIALSVSLMIQALVFGDGGVTALSANCFNIAFIGSFLGYGIYRLVIKIGKHFLSLGGNSAEKEGKSSFSLEIMGTAIGAYAGINGAAFFTALELGIQPFITGGSGYFPYTLAVTLPAVMLPHLMLVGPLEAAVAALVITFLKRGKTAMPIFPKTILLILLSMYIIMLNATGVSAHDFYLEPKGGNILIVFGHGEQREEFDIAKVKQIKVLDLRGKDLSFQREKKEKGLMLKVNGRPAVVTALIDNGYWSKTIYGWKELPKRKASRVVEAIRSLFFSKIILSWSEGLQAASPDIRLDILPLKNPFELKAGDVLPLKVLLREQPLSGAEIEGSEHNVVGKTDKEGVIKAPLIKGLNLLTVEYKEPLKGDPDADVLTLAATLTFEVKQ